MKKMLYFLAGLVFSLVSASQKNISKKEPFHVRALETALIGIQMSAPMSATGGALYSFSSAAELLLKFYQIKNIPRALGWVLLGLGYASFAGLLLALITVGVSGGWSLKKIKTREEKKEALKAFALIAGSSLLSIFLTVVPINLYEKFSQ